MIILKIILRSFLLPIAGIYLSSYALHWSEVEIPLSDWRSMPTFIVVSFVGFAGSAGLFMCGVYAWTEPIRSPKREEVK